VDSTFTDARPNTEAEDEIKLHSDSDESCENGPDPNGKEARGSKIYTQVDGVSVIKVLIQWSSTPYPAV
jgi:hypothetical protein